MAFNIDTFIGNGLTKGGARPSLFDVFVTFGSGINVPDDALTKIRFTCRASSIPASTISPVNVPYFGRTVKLAGDRTFADWSVTVMNDEDYAVRNAFETWHNNINTIISNRRTTTTTAEYKGTADVRQYSKDGQTIIKEYKFINIFPINLEEMALDWDATNQIQTFGATFAYDYWIALDGTGQPTLAVTA
jgi:hypothetical protein